MDCMIKIANETLPQSCLCYLAFRIAFMETLERIILADQIAERNLRHFGYLTEVPFLQAVPPHVQLDLLAETWAKHSSEDPNEASLVDESVIYAACETAAMVVDRDPSAVSRFLKQGPLDVAVEADNFLASELRALHLNLGNEGDFLMISQFEDMPPREAAYMKEKFGLDNDRLEAMFDVLGRWNLSPNFLSNLENLMSEKEIARVAFDLNIKHPV
ncbi:MAG: hypothetical protein KDA65_16790 [Planctomycetaceae bacterium]|nr:hypothetical protein [Planctomycetaceae bacterium]